MASSFLKDQFDDFISQRSKTIQQERIDIERKLQKLKKKDSAEKGSEENLNKHETTDEKENYKATTIATSPFSNNNSEKGEARLSTPLRDNRPRNVTTVSPFKYNTPTKSSEKEESFFLTPRRDNLMKRPQELSIKSKSIKKTPINHRELEKDKLVAAMSTPKSGGIAFGTNSRNTIIRSNESKKFVSNMPLISPRQLEIDRLASLFESSGQSHNRNSKFVTHEVENVTENYLRIPERDVNTPNITPCRGLGRLHQRIDMHGEKSVEGARFAQKSAESYTRNVQPINWELHKENENVNLDEIEDNVIDSSKAEVYNSDNLQTTGIVTAHEDRSPAEESNKEYEYLNRPSGKEHQMRSSIVTVPGNALLGIGEHDSKRKQLIEERKRDYCDYMEQARLQMRNTRHGHNPHGGNTGTRMNHCSYRVCLKDAETQTDVEPPNPYFLEPEPYMGDYRTLGTCTSIPLSPAYSDRSRSPNRSPKGRAQDLHRRANCFPGIAPSTPVLEKPVLGSPADVYMRQYQYREDLKRQIEERQRIEADKRERERLEEEAMERRVREQQEKLRRQYEIEEQERIDYIMRRHIQDDVLRQRLTDMQQHGTDVRREKTAGRQRMRPVALGCDPSRGKPLESERLKPGPENDKPADQGDLERSAELSELAEEILKAPLIGPEDSSPLFGQDVLTAPPRMNVSKQDKVTRKASRTPAPDSRTENSSIFDGPSLHRLEAEGILREPLIPENHNPDDSLPIPILKATSPCVPSLRTRTQLNNAQVLEDKWQIPAVEKNYVRPNPTPSEGHDSYHGRSDNVLTQLGAFRRQLQMEHLRLQERVQHQSKIKPG